MVGGGRERRRASGGLIRRRWAGSSDERLERCEDWRLPAGGGQRTPAVDVGGVVRHVAAVHHAPGPHPPPDAGSKRSSVAFLDDSRHISYMPSARTTKVVTGPLHQHFNTEILKPKSNLSHTFNSA